MGIKVILKYDSLGIAVTRFRAEGEDVVKMHASMSDRVHDLRKEWIGEAADKFFHEMENELLPALVRLAGALFWGQDVLLKIIKTIQTYDQETAGYFKGDFVQISAAKLGAGAGAGLGVAGASVGLGAGLGRIGAIPEPIPQPAMGMGGGSGQIGAIPEPIPQPAMQVAGGSGQIGAIPEPIPQPAMGMAGGSGQIGAIPEPIPQPAIQVGGGLGSKVADMPGPIPDTGGADEG